MRPDHHLSFRRLVEPMIVDAPLMAEIGGPTECAACGAVARGVEFAAPSYPLYSMEELGDRPSTSTTTVWPCGHVFRSRDGWGWDMDENDRIDWGQVAIEQSDCRPGSQT